MMTALRGVAAAAAIGAVAIGAAACATASATQRTSDAETAAMAPLKHAYPAVVMGFDVPAETTLVVSLDLQAYENMDDDAAAAMERRTVTNWLHAWRDAHPGRHALVHVRFIDFIGRTILQRSARV
ncbi:MAG TPA: hypothetical protein VJP76_06965 [Candidatus Tumulicola sp.]|nr:hypothetical protein [Candidatus Tumulicola sp.]